MLLSVPAAGPANPPPPRRQSLEEWRAQLQKLIARRRACPARQLNTALVVQLRSGIRGAYDEISASCGPLRGEVLSQAAAIVAPYFHRVGDARIAAANFPAVAEFLELIQCPALEHSLDGATRQAEEAVALITRILGGRDVWRFRDAAQVESDCAR